MYQFVNVNEWLILSNIFNIKIILEFYIDIVRRQLNLVQIHRIIVLFKNNVKRASHSTLTL